MVELEDLRKAIQYTFYRPLHLRFIGARILNNEGYIIFSADSILEIVRTTIAKQHLNVVFNVRWLDSWEITHDDAMEELQTLIMKKIVERIPDAKDIVRVFINSSQQKNTLRGDCNESNKQF